MSEKKGKDREALSAIQSELSTGMGLPKCQKCGCMKEALENLQSALPSIKMTSSSNLSRDIEGWVSQMEPIKYACLGCEYCYPAVAMNEFNESFSAVAAVKQPGCAFEVGGESWPFVAGEYFAFCHGSECPVAVSTLGDVDLTERLAKIKPRELCIVGKTETENIGVDKLIKNVITNSTIRFLLLAGNESKGHRPGNTVLALSAHGVDEKMRVIDAVGKRPILRNVNRDEVEAFRKQVQVADMIGCEDETLIVEKLKELSRVSSSSCGCQKPVEETPLTEASSVPVIQAKDPSTIQMDKAGYFVIFPQRERKVIIVEHYSYDNTLLRIVEGKDARSIYSTCLEKKWVTLLSHAAYLAKELEKAELSMKFGFKYVQDGA
jgi:tetrahydromethanopterin S-methyltransferase subunit A